MKWYAKILPTIEEMSSTIEEIAKNISSVKGIRGVYAWGPYAEQIDNKNHRIKCIDILADCKFHSGDLLAIDDGDPLGPLSISADDIEASGFDPLAVKFTETCIRSQKPNIDLWALSKDKKLLHWGPIPETVEEWKELRKQAEEYAKEVTATTKKLLSSANIDIRSQWNEAYNSMIREFVNGSPIGWYESNADIDKVMAEIRKIH